MSWKESKEKSIMLLMIYKYITAETKKIQGKNENILNYFQDNKKINML